MCMQDIAIALGAKYIYRTQWNTISPGWGEIPANPNRIGILTDNTGGTAAPIANLKPDGSIFIILNATDSTNFCEHMFINKYGSLVQQRLAFSANQFTPGYYEIVASSEVIEMAMNMFKGS